MNPWSHYLVPSTAEPSVIETSGPESEYVFGDLTLRSCWSSKMGIQTTLNCSDDSMHDAFTVTSSSSSAIPRRNLADAFELHVESEVSTTPAAKQPPSSSDDESPLGVADLPLSDLQDDDDVLPHVALHPELKRDLSQALVNRVSFYGVIHDINKEATAMASNDFLAFTRVKSMDEEDDMQSPLVMAVNGKPYCSRQALSMTSTALIDEERWILSAIELRDEDRSIAECPSTFLQAMGEREYEQVEPTRTQLWKPSRSWWEAKSGKNPWIEPKSHNKRWRYLWPLIHYHKFLAKCIKKLKRNGVDVKVSLSPVCVFLREEVCAVSDHLAAVSLFTSERWMECLSQFEGWTSRKSEAKLRNLIQDLKLRPLDEPGDVDSALLRNQIDEQFLRAMAAARENMSSVVPQPMKRPDSAKPAIVGESGETEVTAESSRPGLPLHPNRDARSGIPQNRSTPRGKSATRSSHSLHTHQAQSSGGDLSSESRSAPYVYHNGHWWGNGWAPHIAVCDENTSVQSALSGDSYMLGYPPSQYDPNYHGMYTMQFYPPQTNEQTTAGSYPVMPYYPQSFDPYNNPEYALAAASGWYGQDPNVIQASEPGTPVGPSSSPQDATDQTGLSPCAGDAPEHHVQQEGDYNHGQMSPFWGHMEYQVHQTLAHAGIVTPHKGPPPSTPHRNSNYCDEDKDSGLQEIEAKPLLLNHNVQYNPYSQMYREGYMPPSPATQFMMSPQANAQAAAYYAAYNHAGYHQYYVSPRRSTARRRTKRASPPSSTKTEDSKIIPPPVIRKVADPVSVPGETSDSDLTAATAAESESVAG